MKNVSDKNTRIAFTISKELKERIEKQAEQEHRSVANLINVALIEYLNR